MRRHRAGAHRQPRSDPHPGSPGDGTFLILLSDVDDQGGAIDPTETGDYTIALDTVDVCSVSATTSTTTTISAAAGRRRARRRAAGDRLPRRPRKDPTLTLGAGNGSGDDPRLVGATLHVVTTSGDAFDDTYALPASHWKLIGALGKGKGYKYADPAGPVHPVMLKPKALQIQASGAGLGHTLATDPNPVGVALTTGGTRYCFRLGGTVTFEAGKLYSAKSAAPPAACP